MKSNVLAVVLIVFVSNSVALAQSGRHSDRGRHGAGGFGGGCVGAGSTVYGSAMLGEAAYIKSLGQYQVMNAQANVLNQQAFAAYLQNRKNYAQTYFDLKRMHQSWVAEQNAKHPRATPEQLVAISRATTPKRLAPNQFDRDTGKLSWPGALQSESFAIERSRLGQIVAYRTAHSNEELKSQQEEVRRLTHHMRDELISHIKELRPMDFVAAKKFLDSLAHDDRLLRVEPRLAANN